MLRIVSKSRDTLFFWGFSLEPKEVKYITDQEYKYNKEAINTGIQYGWLSAVEVQDNVDSVETESKTQRTRKSKKGNN